MYFFFLRLLGGFSRLLFRVHYVGLENLPKKGKLILCCNHRSVLDPLFLARPLRRQVFYMAKSELFEEHGRLVGWFLKKAGAFSVRRNTADKEAFRHAVSLLGQEKILGIFPQGKCVFDQELEFKPKAGVALIAARAGAPVLPVGIYFTGRICPFKKVTVRYGKMISCEELGFISGTLQESREAAKLIADRVTRLLEEKH